jgi:hypothetical protein
VLGIQGAGEEIARGLQGDESERVGTIFESVDVGEKGGDGLVVFLFSIVAAEAWIDKSDP